MDKMFNNKEAFPAEITKRGRFYDPIKINEVGKFKRMWNLCNYLDDDKILPN